MTTTTDIARAHGHNGPTNCQDCGTTESVHFGSWFNPETRESGSFLQCCSCGIKAGDPIYTHVECGSPATRYVPNVCSDPCGQLALQRIKDRAIEAYSQGRHCASNLDINADEVHERALESVLEAIGRAYAAAAISQVAQTLIDKLDEDTYVALGDIAATLDLDVVEDLEGANGTGEDDAGPEVRVFHSADGWTVPYEPGTQTCTINHVPEDEGRQACAATAVWKVVQQRDLCLTIGFWCGGHLPPEHRHLAVQPVA
jgi:hypothetical protein